MKPRFLIFCLIFTSSLAVWSCDKLLDTKPQDFFVAETFYQDKGKLESALAAVYSKLGEDDWLYRGRITRMGLDADDGFYDRANDPLGATSYDIPTTEPNVAAFWRTCYQGITRTNLLLAYMHQAEGVSESDLEIIRGETLFLRGFYYFLLVSNFGGVPLVLEPQGADNTAIPRATVAEVYAQIVADMEDAETIVLPAASVGYGGRITKSAVRGILARVNLFMAGEPLKDISRYAEARKWALSVMEDAEAGHRLNNDYSRVFINYIADRYDIKESIWEIEFFGNRLVGPFLEGGLHGYWNGITYSGNSNYGNSSGLLNATGVLWEKYESPGTLGSFDRRRDWAIAPFTLSGTPAVENPRPITQIYQRDVGKFRRCCEVVEPKEQAHTPINFPVLRFSDVLLMFAEADNQVSNGPTPQAIEAVNKVRRRGYGKYLNGEGAVSESIRAVTVTNGGTGYTTAPAVQIQGGGGEFAKATALIASGSVVGIRVDDPGQKFTSAPTIVIQGNNGSGATAEAALTQMSDADLKAEQTASKETFLKTIQDERSRELCFESLRKGDLVRWGLLMENMKLTLNHVLEANLPSNMSHAAWSYQNVSPRDVVWPIPSYEMGLNSALVQNPGW